MSLIHLIPQQTRFIHIALIVRLSVLINFKNVIKCCARLAKHLQIQGSTLYRYKFSRALHSNTNVQYLLVLYQAQFVVVF